MQTWGLDALNDALRFLQTVLLPDLGVLGLVAAVATLAAVALTVAVVAILSAGPALAVVGAPAVDGIRAPRSVRPDWARPDAPGRRLPRAPGSMLAA